MLLYLTIIAGQDALKTIFQIKTTKGVNIQDFSFALEKEVLIPCDTKWKVIEVQPRNDEGIIVIHLEEVD